MQRIETDKDTNVEIKKVVEHWNTVNISPPTATVNVLTNFAAFNSVTGAPINGAPSSSMCPNGFSPRMFTSGLGATVAVPKYYCLKQ